MKIQQIKKRLEIINENIERIEDLQAFIEVVEAPDNEYFRLFASEQERYTDIKSYYREIKHLENAIDFEIELLNKLK